MRTFKAGLVIDFLVGFDLQKSHVRMQQDKVDSPSPWRTRVWNSQNIWTDRQPVQR